jgi:solute:Na+ symporter, SSS family
VILAIFLAYCAFLLWAAFVRFRVEQKTAGDYILASRRLTLPAFVATLVTTWYGGILGVGEYTWKHGLSNWLVFGVPYYLYAAIFAVFLAGRARRSSVLTIPDRLHERFGLGPALVGAATLFLMSAPAAYVLMLGVLGQIYAGWPMWVGVVLGTLLSVANVYRGGLRNLVLVDIVQFVLMFLAFVVVVPVCARTFGGFHFLAARLPAGHLTWDGGQGMQAVAVWYVIALSTLVEPAFYQRCYAARSVSVARWGVFVSILCWVFFDFLTTSAGLYARALIPNLEDPVAAFPALGQLVLSPFWQGVFLVGMLSVVMSTVDGYTFIAAITVGRDIVQRWNDARNRPTTPSSGVSDDDPRSLPLIRLALVATALFAVILALVSKSVVRLWHDLGSVGTPVLLLPLLASYGTLRISGRWVVLAMTVSGTLSLVWLAAGRGEPFLGVEAIFPGLAASAAIMAVGWLGGRRGR